MKRTWLLVVLCLALSFVSCNKKDDNIITYTSDEIYLNCVECGYISGLPKELLIFESGEQLGCALNTYECIASLAELNTITEEYPIGEFIYLLQYFETDYDSKVVCKGLNVNKEEMWIHLEHKIKSSKEGPSAIKAYVTYAALPKEYLAGCDFSNQQGVLYLGKTADIENSLNENPGSETAVPPGNEAVEPPYILNLESFKKIAELKSMLEEEEDTVADYLDNNNYSMNGLTSKHDIAELFNHVGDLNMFHMDPSSGYNLTSILYYPESDYDFFMSIYSDGRERILFRCFTDASESVYVPEEDAVCSFGIGDKKVALYELEEEGMAYALVGRTETANSRITILLSDDEEESIRNAIEGNIVCSALSDLIEGDQL